MSVVELALWILNGFALLMGMCFLLLIGILTSKALWKLLFRKRQFRLATLFVVITVAAVALAIIKPLLPLTVELTVGDVIIMGMYAAVPIVIMAYILSVLRRE